MLYYLFNYLDQLDFPGAGMFKYVSFRSGLALILSLFISTAIGRRIIDKLQMLQIGETVRNLGLEGQMSKKGTPTMGGIIIIIAILIPTLLCAKLNNIYVILMLVTTVWLGALGFADDYIKVFKKNKEGMHGRFKIVGQAFARQTQRNGTDGLHVVRYVIAPYTVTTRHRLHQSSVFVSQRDGRTVKLQLAADFEVLVQCLPHTFVELPYLRLGIRVAQ